MKTSELIALLQKQLKKSGDLDVFIASDDKLYSAEEVEYEVAEAGDYPRSWNMPESFLKILA